MCPGGLELLGDGGHADTWTDKKRPFTSRNMVAAVSAREHRETSECARTNIPLRPCRPQRWLRVCAAAEADDALRLSGHGVGPQGGEVLVAVADAGASSRASPYGANIPGPQGAPLPAPRSPRRSRAGTDRHRPARRRGGQRVPDGPGQSSHAHQRSGRLDQARQAIDEVRRISNDLRPRGLERLGLLDALAREVGRFGSRLNGGALVVTTEFP